MRRFCQIVDEFTSDQNARHAQQGLIETARQGFWPVVKAPFGYEKYEAEWRGSKPKWKLRIEASEAAIVRELYSLRSEEHTSELQSLMRISYAVFCVNKTIRIQNLTSHCYSNQTD